MNKGKKRVNNPVLRKYLIRTIPEKLEGNPFFVKIFGKGYAKSKMISQINAVYTNEETGIENYAGYHSGSEKSITLCKSGADGKLLSPQDVANSEYLQEVSLHESIHAILSRSVLDTFRRNIYSGTGILEGYYNRKTKTYSELGRGLNEGYTEWLCEKTGYKANAYPELTNFIRLIESAIGTERCMALGKGEIRKKFPELLDMSLDETLRIIGLSDSLYKVNDDYRLYSDLSVALAEKRNLPQDSSQEAIDKSEKRIGKYADVIEKIKSDPFFLKYIKDNGKDINNESIEEYLNNELIPQLFTQRCENIMQFQNIILDKYFMKDVSELLEGDTMSLDNFLKFTKLVSVLNFLPSTFIDKLDTKQKSESSTIVIQEFYKQHIKELISRVAKEEAEKIDYSSINLSQVLNFGKKLTESGLGVSYLQAYISSFSQAVSADFGNEIKDIIETAYRFEKNEEFLSGIQEVSIYRLTNDDKDNPIKVNLIYSKDNFYDKIRNNSLSIDNKYDKEVEFVFTTDLSVDDEYEIAMKNFLKLRDEVFSKNPNAKIHISSREIIVQDGEDLKFYHIHMGQLIPMSVEKQLDLNFDTKERESREDVTLPAIKVSSMSNVVNSFRRKLNAFKSKVIRQIPKDFRGDESTGKISFSSSNTGSGINKYKIDKLNIRNSQSQLSTDKSIDAEDRENDAR